LSGTPATLREAVHAVDPATVAKHPPPGHSDSPPRLATLQSDRWLRRRSPTVNGTLRYRTSFDHMIGAQPQG
jgi:hypothetical protein